MITRDQNQAEPSYKPYSNDTLGEVYILHLCTPLGHARHYVGFSKKLSKRISHHRNNTGARFTQVCNERGIEYVLAVRFNGTKKDERRLKNTNHTARYCPFCTDSPLIFQSRVLPHEQSYTILYDGC